MGGSGSTKDFETLRDLIGEQAEYWDSPGSAVGRLYGLTKALATGDKDAIGDNAKISR